MGPGDADDAAQTGGHPSGAASGQHTGNGPGRLAAQRGTRLDGLAHRDVWALAPGDGKAPGADVGAFGQGQGGKAEGDGAVVVLARVVVEPVDAESRLA